MTRRPRSSRVDSVATYATPKREARRKDALRKTLAGQNIPVTTGPSGMPISQAHQNRTSAPSISVSARLAS